MAYKDPQELLAQLHHTVIEPAIILVQARPDQNYVVW